MTYDECNEITNSQETYNSIAGHVRLIPILIGWTDEEGTHYDLLFAYRPGQFGNIGGGIRSISAALFVGVLRHGCFAFECDEVDTDQGYYAEKLGFGRRNDSSTMAALADLINGVRAALIEREMGGDE